VRDDFTELPVYGIRKPYFNSVILWCDFQYLDPSHHNLKGSLECSVDGRLLPACGIKVWLAQNLLDATRLGIQAVQASPQGVLLGLNRC
jgi:hypothetical protein